jgi:D-amino peptidase
LRVLVIADMEGVSGIDSHVMCRRSEPEYQTGQQLLAAELRMITGACVSAGATNVSIIDWHAGGGNLTNDMLCEGHGLVPEDLTPGYDVVLLTGFHAMAGTGNAFISHTMSQNVSLEMNGDQCGELALLSRWAGEAGIPVGLVTGDQATVDEAQRFLPGTPAVSVKQAVSAERADCLPVAVAHARIDEAIRDALTNPANWNLYRNSLPVQVRVRLDPEPAMAIKIPWVTRESDGWLAGEVRDTKAVIDLIDLFTALKRV